MENARTSALAHIALLMLLALFSYGHTLNSEFHLDDIIYIIENPLVTSHQAIFSPDALLDDPSLPEPLIRTRKSRWLGYLSFNINHRAGGLDVRGYHLVNIFIHIINGLLLYALLRLSFAALRYRSAAAPWLALLGAALFVTHPIQTQGVTYISQRFTSMAAMLCLASAVSYIRWRLKQSARYLALATLLSAAAMLTKENSFVLPIALAAYEFCFFKDDTRGLGARLAGLAPLFATMLIVPMALMGSPDGAGGGAAADMTVLDTDIPRSAYLITQFRVIMTYMRLLAFPIGQNLDYDYPLYTTLLEPLTLLSALALSTVLLGALWAYQRLIRQKTYDTQTPWAMVIVGALWMFIFLSVESSAIVLVNLIFEHRMYLPMAGVCMAVAGGAGVLINRHAHLAKPLVATCVAVLVTLTAASHMRNRAWHDEITLWSDVVAKSPMKVRGHNELGLALMDEGRYKEAIAQFELAVEMKPDYAKGHMNLALLYAIDSSFVNASRHCEQAVLHDTGNYVPCINLADLLAANGKPGGARMIYEGLTRFAPTDPALSRRLKSVQATP